MTYSDFLLCTSIEQIYHSSRRFWSWTETFYYSYWLLLLLLTITSKLSNKKRNNSGKQKRQKANPLRTLELEQLFFFSIFLGWWNFPSFLPPLPNPLLRPLPTPYLRYSFAAPRWKERQEISCDSRPLTSTVVPLSPVIPWAVGALVAESCGGIQLV